MVVKALLLRNNLRVSLAVGNKLVTPVLALSYVDERRRNFISAGESVRGIVARHYVRNTAVHLKFANGIVSSAEEYACFPSVVLQRAYNNAFFRHCVKKSRAFVACHRTVQCTQLRFNPSVIVKRHHEKSVALTTRIENAVLCFGSQWCYTVCSDAISCHGEPCSDRAFGKIEILL